MKVDVYKRPDSNGSNGDFSYLAVPQGKPIPNEATNIDWETVNLNVDLDESHRSVADLEWEDAQEQINAKGYAITSLQSKTSRPSAH